MSSAEDLEISERVIATRPSRLDVIDLETIPTATFVAVRCLELAVSLPKEDVPFCWASNRHGLGLGPGLVCNLAMSPAKAFW